MGPSHSRGHGRPRSSEASAAPASAVTGQQLKIYKAEMVTVPRKLAPGELYSDGKSLLAVGTADGAVSVLDLQLEGKKRMDVRAFLAGFRNPENHKCM